MIKNFRDFFLHRVNEDEDSDADFQQKFSKYKDFLAKKSTGSSSKTSGSSGSSQGTKTSGIFPEVLPIKDSYQKIAEEIIDKFEGGYYHPDMLKDGRVKDSRYKSSGETMMGIDRKTGKNLLQTPEGKEFWKIIDDVGARKKWPWNHKGGTFEARLRKLAAKMIKRNFDEYFKKYLDPASQSIVKTSAELMYHFIYATWNGPGWFKKFADDINKKVRAKVDDNQELVKTALNSRMKEGLTTGSSPNSLIKQTGEKMEKIFKDPSFKKNYYESRWV